jgi:hypothetical protein
MCPERGSLAYSKAIVPFFVYDHSADDFRNQVGPTYDHQFMWGVIHNFSSNFDLKAMVISLHQMRNSGLNAADADTIHFKVFACSSPICASIRCITNEL